MWNQKSVCLFSSNRFMVLVCAARVYGRGGVVGNNVSWSLVYDYLSYNIPLYYLHHHYFVALVIIDYTLLLFCLSHYNYITYYLVYSCKMYTRLKLMSSLITNYPFMGLNK